MSDWSARQPPLIRTMVCLYLYRSRVHRDVLDHKFVELCMEFYTSNLAQVYLKVCKTQWAIKIALPVFLWRVHNFDLCRLKWIQISSQLSSLRSCSLSRLWYTPITVLWQWLTAHSWRLLESWTIFIFSKLWSNVCCMTKTQRFSGH
jgi:hypothetical protein